MPSTPNISHVEKISQVAAHLCLGLTPFLIVPGLNQYTLTPRLLVLQCALLVLAAAWAWKRRTCRWSPLLLPALGFFALMALSPFWAVNPFRSVYDLSKHLSLFLFFFLLLQTFRLNHLPALLVTTSLSGALIGLLGIGEYLGLLPHVIPSTGRPSATFGFRNLAALYLVANIPFALLLFLTARNTRNQIIGGAATTLMVIFLIYTRGRASYVSFAGAALFSTLLWLAFGNRTFWPFLRTALNRKTAYIGLCGLLAIGLLGPMSERFKEHHQQRFDEKKADISSALQSIVTRGGDRGRLIMWRHTLSMIADAPIRGVGLGNWEIFYPLYDRGQMIGPRNHPARPHNDFLWIWAEQGTPAFLCYLAFLFIFFNNIRHILCNPSDPQHRLIAFVCCFSASAVILTGCFDFPRERITPPMFFYFSCALAALLHSQTIQRPCPRWIAAGIPLLLLLGIGITVRHIAFDVHYVRAFKAHLLKDHSDMASEAERALGYGPFDHQIFVIQGQGYAGLGRYEQAVQSYRRGLTYHPYFANFYSNLGHVYQLNHQYADALSAYRAALDINPAHYLAHYNLGTAFQALGQPDSATIAYQKALRLGGAQGKTYLNLGVVLMQQGLPDSAVALYHRALTAPEPAPEALINLGGFYASQGQFDNALDLYRQFLDAAPDTTHVRTAHHHISEAWAGLGIQAEQLGAFDRAIAHYQQAIRHWPENARNWFNLGNAHRERGDIDQAMHAYRESLNRDPNSADTYNNLGLLYHDNGDCAQAIDLFEKARGLAPEWPVVYLNLGNACALSGRYPEAIAAYTAFLERWQGDAATAEEVRRYLIQLKQP